MVKLDAGDDRGEPSISSIELAARRRQIEALFRTHEGFLRWLATRLCGSVFDPEDLLQDVLERTVMHFHALSSHSDHRAWMARVMRNLFIDRVRRRAASPPADALDADPPAPVADAREWWEGLDADDIRAKLSELPDEQRAAFELFAFEGCSYKEIAKRLGIPKQMTVGTRILRARRRLKELFLDRRDPEVTDD
jgi:RNA polymerase sigma-70 factor, ECF subfamily